METIKDLCGFPGFRAQARVKEHPLDPGARIVVLKRRQKKRYAPAAAPRYGVFGIEGPTEYVTLTLPLRGFIWSLSTGGYSVRGAEQ